MKIRKITPQTIMKIGVYEEQCFPWYFLSDNEEFFFCIQPFFKYIELNFESETTCKKLDSPLHWLFNQNLMTF